MILPLEIMSTVVAIFPSKAGFLYQTQETRGPSLILSVTAKSSQC